MNSKIFVESANYNLIHDSQFPMIWQMITTLVFFILLFSGCSKETREFFRNRKKRPRLNYQAVTTGENRVVNLIWRVNVGSWLLIFPDPIVGAEITWPLSLQSRNRRKSQPVTVVVPSAVIKIHGRWFQLQQSVINKFCPVQSGTR